MKNYRHIEVRPIAGALGAEISGVDMARDLDTEVVSEVRHALLEHLVIFLRDQKATPMQQLAFAQELLLPDYLFQRLRPHAIRQRRRAAGLTPHGRHRRRAGPDAAVRLGRRSAWRD